MSDKNKTNLGERFRAIRQGLGLSQAEFATKLGLISEAAIGFFESNACLPDAPILITMAEVFGIDLHELLTGKPSPAVSVEVQRLRELKHKFRGLINTIGPHLQTLQNIKRNVKTANKVLQKTVDTFDAGDKKTNVKSKGIEND